MNRRILPLVLACVLLPTAACNGKDNKAADPTPSPVPVVTTPAPTLAPQPVLKDFLTGTAPRATGPVIGIKVDNAALARPYQRGLDKAALVYAELVEGGSTRFLAVFEGAPDVEVGPVRSVRESDVELLGQYGPIALGFSGGNAGVLSGVRRAVSQGKLVDVSFDALPAAYRLAERRRDARNFFTRPSVLAQFKPDAGTPKDTGLRFAVQPGGTPLTSLRASFSTSYAMTVTWSASRGVYRLSQSGGAIKGAAPKNVIIQRVPIRKSRYSDIHGVPTPYTESIGSGEVLVLRDGKQYKGTWSRASASSPTRYRDAAGKDIGLHPGRSWILLVPTSGSVRGLS